MSDSVIRDLKDYIFHERHVYELKKQKKKTNAFFLNAWGQRMAGDYLNKRLKILTEKTRNSKLMSKEISLHSLRHSIATHLLDGGASIEFVRTFLGHREIDTVHIYARRRKRKNIYK